MGRHHSLTQRRTLPALVVVALVFATLGWLLPGPGRDSVAQLLVRLTNTVIAAGGKDDTTSERFKDKLRGTVVPGGYQFQPIPYPASLEFIASRDAGVPLVHIALTQRAGEEHLIVAGYSEGALVAEQVRRDLQARPVASAPPDSQVSFVLLASPFAGNGGLLARFPQLAIPGIIDPMGAGQPTRYDTTYYANEYDPVADFPAYFNPLSLANAAVAFLYRHPDPAYDPIDPMSAPRLTHVVDDNGRGGKDTYVLFLAQRLPLLEPIREAAQMLSLTPITEPVLRVVEPLLRVAIDAGYTDRTYVNAHKPTPFSLFTPPAKVVETLAKVPGAIAEGLATLHESPATARELPHAAREPERDEAATEPAVKPDRPRIIRPTVTSLGNKVSPTTVAGDASQHDPPPTAATIPAVETAMPATEPNAEQATEPTEQSNVDPTKPGTEASAGEGQEQAAA